MTCRASATLTTDQQAARCQASGPHSAGRTTRTQAATRVRSEPSREEHATTPDAGRNQEQRLTGGTRPGVVRVGDSVRRPAGRHTPTIDALLRHLGSVDFPAPRPLGTDELGRQILTWLPGTTTWDEHACFWGSIERVRQAAALIRRLHEALDTFQPPRDATWPGGWGRIVGPRRGPICHGDLAPYNVVASWMGELGIIDWDGAGPGDRMAELAFAAESFALLRRDAQCEQVGYHEPPARVERLDAFVASYGLRPSERPALADALIENARDRINFGVEMHRKGREPWASWWAADEGAGDREDLAITESIVGEWRRGI